MTAVNIGAIGPDQLGKLIKGWAKKSLEVIDLNIPKTNMLEAAFPAMNLDYERIEFFYTRGNPGRMGVALDAEVSDTKWKYSRYYKDLYWDKFNYMISDSAKTRAAVNRMATDGAAMATRFFGAVREYRLITELKAKNNTNCTAAATALWNSASANVEGDILTAIETITKYTGINPSNYSFGVLFQSSVMRGINQLDLIHNVQQTLKDYMQAVWKINFYAYTPFMDYDGNKYLDAQEQTSSDALSTSALVFVEGDQTLRAGRYAPTDIPLSETSRIHDVGYKTTLRHCYGALAVPMFDDSSYTTPMIYEITSASS